MPIIAEETEIKESEEDKVPEVPGASETIEATETEVEGKPTVEVVKEVAVEVPVTETPVAPVVSESVDNRGPFAKLNDWFAGK